MRSPAPGSSPACGTGWMLTATMRVRALAVTAGQYPKPLSDICQCRQQYGVSQSWQNPASS